MTKILRFLILAAWLAACAPKPLQPTNSGQTIGYHWEIVKDTLDARLVQYVSHDYQSTGDPGPAGGGGVDIWKFKALSAGSTQIVLGYYPPSNTPANPERTETFNVSLR